MGRLTVRRRTPAGGEHVQVTAAHTTVGNLNVDVVLLPLLWLELAPLHVALRRRLIDTEPTLEL